MWLMFRVTQNQAAELFLVISYINAEDYLRLFQNGTQNLFTNRFCATVDHIKAGIFSEPDVLHFKSAV